MQSFWLKTLLVFLPLAALLAVYLIHWKLGTEDLSAWGAYMTGARTILVAFAALYAGVHGLREYQERSRAEKMRWLSKFFEEFYENKRFRMIRQKIDFGDFSEIKRLLEKGAGTDFAQEERDLFDDFTDYLNFFEMIAYLKKRDQIDDDEMRAMFDYYFRRLVEIPEGNCVLEYLRAANFGNLYELLLEYKKENA